MRKLFRELAAMRGVISYKNMEFYPYLRDEDKKEKIDVYNAWGGFKYAYKNEETKFPSALNHLDVIVNHDEKMKTYVINWLSHLIQKPFEKPGVALCFKSEQGTGKSIFWDCIKDIIGKRYTETFSKMALLTGSFNASLEHKLLIVSEEVSDFACIKDSQVLKELRTAKAIQVHKKYMNPYMTEETRVLIE